MGVGERNNFPIRFSKKIKRANRMTESECCGAPIKWTDICTQCGEHTEVRTLDAWGPSADKILQWKKENKNLLKWEK